MRCKHFYTILGIIYEISEAEHTVLFLLGFWTQHSRNINIWICLNQIIDFLSLYLLQIQAFEEKLH